MVELGKTHALLRHRHRLRIVEPLVSLRATPPFKEKEMEQVACIQASRGAGRVIAES